MKIYGTIKKGVFNHLKPLCDALIQFEGKEIIVEVRERKKVRSIKQNKYYWKVVIPAVVEVLWEMGNNEADEEMAHEVCKACFMPPEGIKKVKGRKREMEHRSTRFLSTKGFEAYTETIRQWAASEGKQILLPNEVEYI
jgi:hypothetical protein